MLYAGRNPVHLRRIDEDTLELSAQRGWPKGGALVTTDTKIAKGERRRLRHMAIEVMEVSGEGVPTRARFDFDQPLREGAPLLLAWHGSVPGRVPMLDIGQQIALEAAR
jgi:hypothetical protein